MTDTASPHADLVAALGALTEAPRAGKVSAGQRNYRFMTLPDLLGAVRPVFAKHNLAVTQLVHNHETGVSVETRFIHASGLVFEFPPLTLRCGSDPQSIGSAITYGRRYQLAALVGLAGSDDDDGEEATRTTPKAPARVPTQPPGGFLNGSPTPGSASPQSVKYLWTLLKGLDISERQIRAWVAQQLQIGEDWSTKDLSQQQVSVLIERLKSKPKPKPAQTGDTTPEEAADGPALGTP